MSPGYQGCVVERAIVPLGRVIRGFRIRSICNNHIFSMVLMPDRVRRYGPLVRRQRMHKQDRFLNQDFSRVHPLQGPWEGFYMARVIPLALVWRW